MYHGMLDFEELKQHKLVAHQKDKIVYHVPISKNIHQNGHFNEALVNFMSVLV